MSEDKNNSFKERVKNDILYKKFYMEYTYLIYSDLLNNQTYEIKDTK